MNTPAYVVDVACQDVRLQALVNGYLCYRARDDGRRLAQVKVNSFVLEGKNDLEVIVRQTGPEPWCEIRLLLGQHEVADEEPTDLLYYRWYAEEQPIAREHDTTVLRHRWSMRRAFGRWAWESATPYLDADRPAVEALLVELQRALDRRDLEGYLDRFDVKNEELARSTEQAPADLRKTHRGLMEWAMAIPGMTARLPPLSELELTASAGGRLVEVTQRDGTAPLRVEHPDGFDMGVELVVSQVGGRWQVVR